MNRIILLSKFSFFLFFLISLLGFPFRQQMLLDQNLVDQEKYNLIVEYIQMHNKHQLEYILQEFYQELNKRENLKEKRDFINLKLNFHRIFYPQQMNHQHHLYQQYLMVFLLEILLVLVQLKKKKEISSIY